jgi:hypothetical protein
MQMFHKLFSNPFVKRVFAPVAAKEIPAQNQFLTYKVGISAACVSKRKIHQTPPTVHQLKSEYLQNKYNSAQRKVL